MESRGTAVSAAECESKQSSELNNPTQPLHSVSHIKKNVLQPGNHNSKSHSYKGRNSDSKSNSKNSSNLVGNVVSTFVAKHCFEKTTQTTGTNDALQQTGHGCVYEIADDAYVKYSYPE